MKLAVNKFNGGQIFKEENTVIFQSKLWIKNNSLRLNLQNSLTKFKFNNQAVFIEHIKGHILLGEISILIAVSCKHRDQAYQLSRFFIEEIKKKSPIWKKEHYENEDSEWLEGNPIQTK